MVPGPDRLGCAPPRSRDWARVCRFASYSRRGGRQVLAPSRCRSRANYWLPGLVSNQRPPD